MPIHLAQQVRDHVCLPACHAAADVRLFVVALGPPDLDLEAVQHLLAVARPQDQPDDVLAVLQRAWRAMEGKAAAQGIRPVRIGDGDVLTRQAAMRFAEALLVQVHRDRGHARLRHCPALDRQSAGDRVDRRPGDDQGVVEREAELGRIGRRLRSVLDRRSSLGGAGVGLGGDMRMHEPRRAEHVVHAVVDCDPQVVFAFADLRDAALEQETGEPCHRNLCVGLAHVGPRQPEFGIAEFLAVEVNADAGDPDSRDRPAGHPNGAVGCHAGLIAEEMDLPARIAV